MSHTYTRILIHLIFSTKNREPLIDESIRGQLHAYIAGIVKESGGDAISINGTADHAHALIALPSNRSVSEMARLIKTNSSKWLHETHRKSAFGWQRGYSAFSVSQSILAKVDAYVVSQEEHHRKLTFQEEYLGFLRKHDIPFDERYVWG